MLKKLTFLLAIIMIIASVCLFASCDKDEGDTPPSGDGGTTDNGGGTPTLSEFQGITFDNKTVDYNGTEQSLTIGGTALPAGATVAYTDNKGTDAGVYNATATVTCEGYKTLVLNATLTINKINIPGVTLSGHNSDYDGTKKTVSVEGTIPDGVTVAYTGGEDGANGATNSGTYNIVATLKGKNYNDLVLNATIVINKLNIQGVTFTGHSSDYNAAKKSISVDGTIPEGVNVTYTGGEDGLNGAITAGTYPIVATLTGRNHNTLVLNASLVINKIDLQGITFDSKSFDYDTTEKTIIISGNVPQGVNVVYTGGEDGRNGATNVGKHEITVTLSGANYKTLVLTATITIKSEEELLSVVVLDDSVYFQNSLDKNKLYVYNSDVITRVNNDVATSMVLSGSNIYYLANNVLSDTIMSINAVGEESALFDVSAEMLITDGTYIYYNVNSLTNADKTGIWKIKISDLENDSIDAAPTRVTAVKSDWLVYANGYIYFSNKSDGGKLYAISASANNGTPTLIFDYKISDMIVDENKIYFTKHTLTSAAIFSIDVTGGLCSLINDNSTKLVKITMSNGKYLTKINDYIYFVNVDMLTSNLFGDGIYKAKADGSSLVGDTYELLFGAAKVVDGSEDNLFSLSTDGESLYYYRANSKHLVSLDLTTMEETDLMEGFEPPVYNPIITTYDEKTVLHNNEIYFINMRDGGKLYKYNVLTETEYCVTSTQVADFDIYGDYLYYATIKLIVNYDLYRMSLITGEPERISTDKCLNFSFNGDKLYYTNFSGSNTFNRMNLDGTGVEVLFDTKSVDNNKTVVYNGDIYFVADEYFYKYNIASGQTTRVSTDMKPLDYIIHDGKILMMNCKGSNTIGYYDIATDKFTSLGALSSLMTVSDDIRGMFIYNNDIYYYRNRAVESNEKGLYKVSLTGTPTPELVTVAEGYRLCNSVVVGNNLYFINVWQLKGIVPSNQTDANCAKLCVMDLTTFEITVLN